MPPFDVNTGLAPAMWRSNSIAVQVGIFKPNGASLDLTGFQYLQFTVATSQNAPTNLITSVVHSGEITPTISQADWLDGLAQQAEFDLSASATDVTLLAQPTQPYWMQLSGVNAAGVVILLGAGTINFYNSGSATPAPLPGASVSFNERTSLSGNFNVVAGSQLHTEIVNVSGSAGTRNVIVLPTDLVAGAHIWIRFILPTTDGIIFNIYNQTIFREILFTVQTDPSGYLPAALFELIFDGRDLKRFDSIIPANGQQD